MHIIVGIVGLLLALAPTLYFWLSGLGLARVLVFLLLTVIGFIAGAQVPPPNLTRIPTDEC